MALSMLTPEQVQAVLDEKPWKDWTFRAYMGRWEGMHVSLTYTAPNNFNPDQTWTSGVECFLSPNDIATEDTVRIWRKYRIERVETHEMREQLAHLGLEGSDPHAEYADRDLP
jgi:hypothetical protein